MKYVDFDDVGKSFGFFSRGPRVWEALGYLKPSNYVCLLTNFFQQHRLIETANDDLESFWKEAAILYCKYENSSQTLLQDVE
jgi:hypothetical protein